MVQLDTPRASMVVHKAQFEIVVAVLQPEIGKTIDFKLMLKRFEQVRVQFSESDFIEILDTGIT